MKNIVFIISILCLVLLISCKGKNESGTDSVVEGGDKSTSENDTVVVDSIYNYGSSIKNDSMRKIGIRSEAALHITKITEGEPNLTRLPINTHELFMSYRMREFIDQSPEIYRLPSINKLFFVPIYGYYRNRVKEFCVSSNKLNKIKIDSILNFTSYRYKLPNIYNYKAFISCNSGWSDYRIEKFNIASCKPFLLKDAAYLLLYDTNSSNVNVIELFGSSNDYGFSGRTFDIDKNFVITIKDYQLFRDYNRYEDDGETPFSEYKITNIYKVYILDNGSIKVDFPKMYGFKYDDKDTAWGVRDSIGPMTIVYSPK